VYDNEDQQLIRIDLDGESFSTTEESQRLRDFIARPLTSIEARRLFRALAKAHDERPDRD
jgi:hypothetical protein